MRERFENWEERYSFDRCGLNNKEYGLFLSTYLRSQKKPLVLNLNGAWGTGKTHFLRQIYSDLHFKHGYPVIYIDAWRSDFSNDPLLVLVSEFIEQFKSLSKTAEAQVNEDQMLKVVGKFAKKAWNVGSVGVASYIAEKSDDNTILELAKTMSFNDVDSLSVGRNLNENYNAQLSAIEDTTDALKKYLQSCSGDKKKVFVLIDELDRCRPTYAIEMLETIKHFFSLENYVFVVATDTKQLSHSIKAVYGSTFDGTEYLSRFFNRSAALPLPDKKRFATLLVKDSILEDRKDEMKLLDSMGYDEELASRLLSEVSVMYNLSLRRMEQVFDKFESCIIYELDNNERYFDMRLLMQLIAEYDSVDYNYCYSRRKESVGVRLDLSKEFHESIKSGRETDEVATVAIEKNKVEMLKLNSNSSYIQNTKIAYMLSWELVNNFSNKEQSLTSTVESVSNKLTEKLHQISQHRVGQQSNYKEDLMFEYKRNLQPVHMYDRNRVKVWTRDDYFKAVELAAQITTDTSSES